jgi:hypothetical protein
MVEIASLRNVGFQPDTDTADRLQDTYNGKRQRIMEIYRQTFSQKNVVFKEIF